MRVRSVLLAVTAAVALSAVPLSAHAGTVGGRTEMHDRSIFDGAVEKTADSMHFEGQARGELGYFLDVTVTAKDGSLPTGSNVCEPADVSAKLTLPSRESMSVQVEGDLCTSFFGDSLSLFAGFTQDDFTFHGTAIRRASLIDEGFISRRLRRLLRRPGVLLRAHPWTR